MNLNERLQLLSDPFAQDRWEHLYDELDQIPPLAESEIELLRGTLADEPKCDYPIVRLFCLDLLAANSVQPVRILGELKKLIENGHDAERSTAFQLVRKTSIGLSTVLAMLEEIDASKLPFLARWELRRLIKKKRTESDPET